MYQYLVKYNAIYKIIYFSCFISFLRINDLSRLNIDIALQDIFFFENINNAYKHKDRL